ncbi:hypothetical protein QMP28_07225 [[Clostridium] symbiosum]|uniref:hypothetical protein n=1 Tax=Clostridium symbiosum TaxID=1512 RepID=UPI003312FE91
MKFEMICTGGPFGDSCCNYDVRIEGNCTVREFIESVLKEKPGEWGTFEIVKDMKYTLQSMTKGPRRAAGFPGLLLCCTN